MDWVNIYIITIIYGGGLGDDCSLLSLRYAVAEPKKICGVACDFHLSHLR